MEALSLFVSPLLRAVDNLQLFSLSHALLGITNYGGKLPISNIAHNIRIVI